MYLSYFGIRVTDLEKSLKFYSELFGLREVARGDNAKYGGGIYVLLRDVKSGQKLELNWYPPSSPHATVYLPGEGLDHVAFKVENITETFNKLVARGVELTEIDPSRSGGRLAYVKDPDGNWIELYEQAQPTSNKIPDGY